LKMKLMGRCFELPLPLHSFLLYLSEPWSREKQPFITDSIAVLQAPQDGRGVSKQYGGDTMIHRLSKITITKML
jgi:hypothetical protein